LLLTEIFAVSRVELFTVVEFTVMPLPAKLAAAPLTKFEPVKMTLSDIGS
jgi:hypothetical protein